MKRVLIVNADDFGVAPAANQGILDAYQAGSVTSTTLMVNGKAAEAAATLASANPGLGVGLHFNLTLGRPTSAAERVSSLVDANGVFRDRQALARRLLTGRIDRHHVATELHAQFARMKDLGLEPTHIDSHQHVHGFRIPFDCVAGFCAERALPMRVPWILRGIGRPSAGRFMRQALLGQMIQRSTRRWGGKVRWNDGLGSTFDLCLPPGPFEVAHYRQVLQAAPEAGVFELMVHPVSDARELHGLTRIGEVSEWEWKFLRTGVLRALAQELGFKMATFGTAFNR